MKVSITKINNIYYFENKDIDLYHSSKNLAEGMKFVEEKFSSSNEYLSINNINNKNKTILNKNLDLKKFNFLTSLYENFVRSVFNLIVLLFFSFFIVVIVIGAFKKNEIKGGRQFWKNIENEISKLADRDINKNSEEKIINSLKKIREKYKPYLDELKKF